MKKYFKHKLENLIIIKKIVTIHYLELKKDFKTSGESHDFWELVYADKSNVICTADGKEIALKQGEMIFHKPNEFHSLAADKKTAPNVFIISFECKSTAMKFFENKKITLDKGYLKYVYAIIEESKKTFDLPHFNPAMKRLVLKEQPTLGGEQIIKNHLEVLLINIMRSLTETESGNEIFLQKSEFDSALVREIISILQNSVYGKISVSDVSRRISYSKAYIFKRFKSETGKTILDYYLNLKIEKAKQLLRENELSVKEISEKLCFDTPNYFTKTFKRVVSVTPLAYKKRYAENA